MKNKLLLCWTFGISHEATEGCVVPNVLRQRGSLCDVTEGHLNQSPSLSSL